MAAQSSTASSGGVSAESYIGSLISLTSKSEIRYEGVLYNINTEESSIGLRNVRSFGTEGRKKDGPQVPPIDQIYEYILFRGSDIKDLQVKASASVPSTPPINNDPAIIQSHYPRPSNAPMNLPSAASGTLGNQISSHSAQTGFPGSTFQSGLPLYQPGTNLNSWGPSQPNANGGGLAMPMYWQGFYSPPNVMPQPTLFQPPHGLSVPPSMQFSDFSSSSFATASQGLPASSSQDHQQSSPVADSTSYSSASTLAASTLSLNVPSLHHPGSLSSGTLVSQLQNITPVSSLSTSAPVSILPSLSPLSTSVPANAGSLLPSAASQPNLLPSSAALPQQPTSQPRTSLIGTLSTETLAPSLVTPGQLLQFGKANISAPSQPLETAHKDVEVVQESPKGSSEPSAPVATEAQPPLLPTPPNARAHKPNGVGRGHHMRNNYRGRGGRGYVVSRPLTKFTEDFDFSAMNEKFNKDEIWGDLGKKSQPKDKEENGIASNGDDSQDEDDTELQDNETKTVYNKDDFFDSLSCNALDNDPNHGRTRYSEQMKLDTETFGDFSRYRGGRGGRGYNRGGGRFRGSYHGRGYGYGNRGRGGRGAAQNRS